MRKRYLHGRLPRRRDRPGARSDLSGRAARRRRRRRCATLADGEHRLRRDAAGDAKNPMIVLGQGALARADGAAVLALARELAESCGIVRDGLERLQRAAHRGGARRRPRSRLRAGRRAGATSPASSPAAQTGEIEVRLSARRRRDRHRAARQGLRDLPGPSRRSRRRTAPTSSCRAPPIPRRTAPTSTPRAACSSARRAVFPPGEAREDWAILRALSERARASRCRTTRSARSAPRLVAAHPIFAAHRSSIDAGGLGRVRRGRRRSTDAPFVSPIADFYLTDPISRASRDHGRMHRARVARRP